MCERRTISTRHSIMQGFELTETESRRAELNCATPLTRMFSTVLFAEGNSSVPPQPVIRSIAQVYGTPRGHTPVRLGGSVRLLWASCLARAPAVLSLCSDEGKRTIDRQRRLSCVWCHDQSGVDSTVGAEMYVTCNVVLHGPEITLDIEATMSAVRCPIPIAEASNCPIRVLRIVLRKAQKAKGASKPCASTVPHNHRCAQSHSRTACGSRAWASNRDRGRTMRKNDEGHDHFYLRQRSVREANTRLESLVDSCCSHDANELCRESRS